MMLCGMDIGQSLWLHVSCRDMVSCKLKHLQTSGHRICTEGALQTQALCGVCCNSAACLVLSLSVHKQTGLLAAVERGSVGACLLSTPSYMVLVWCRCLLPSCTVMYRPVVQLLLQMLCCINVVAARMNISGVDVCWLAACWRLT
jgi:hypothetical protein